MDANFGKLSSLQKIAALIGVLMSTLALLFLCFALLPTNVAYGQAEPTATPTPTPDPTSWQKVSYARSWEAPVQSVAVDCNNTAHIYVGTNAGLFRSNDEGTTWITLTDQLDLLAPSEDLDVRAIAISCQEPSTIFVGTTMGLLRSKTTGNTWELVDIAGGLPVTPTIQTVAVDPMNHLVAYVGTQSHGVYKTTNGGDSWQAINEGLASLSIYVIIIDPHRSNRLYVGTSSAGVFKSADGGHSWTQASQGVPLPFECYRLAVNHREPNTIYASIARVEDEKWIGLGVYKSTNGGISWNPSSAGLSSRAVVYSMVVDPGSPDTLYIGSYNNVYKSIDSGQSWVRMREGLPHGAWVTAIGIDPKSPRILYAGTGSGELFVSNDSGQSWTGLYSGLPEALHINTIVTVAEADGTVYLGTTQGVFKSTDSGLTWVSANRGITNTNISSIAVQPNDLSIVLAGTSGGQIYRSEDRGQHWILTRSGLDGSSVNNLVVSLHSSNVAFATLEAGGLLKSNDGGHSWHEIQLVSNEAPIRDIVEDVHISDTLYMATWGTGVMKSEDGGQTWFSANNGLDSPFVSSLAKDLHTSGVLYSYVDRWGIFKTVDGGITWSRIGGDIPTTETVSRLLIDPVLETVMYARTESGIYLSNDGGSNWLPASKGLPEDASITTIAADLTAPGNVYVGTRSQGLLQGDILKIARASQPFSLYRTMQGLFGLSRSDVNGILIALSGIYILIRNRRFVRDIPSHWTGTVFRPSKLFEQIRDGHIPPGRGSAVYVLCTLGSLIVLYSVFYRLSPDTTRETTVNRIWQAPHLRFQMSLVTSVLSRLNSVPQISGEILALISYAAVSFLLWISVAVLATELDIGIGLGQGDRPNKDEQMGTALLFSLSFANTTSLVVFLLASVALGDLIPFINANFGLAISMVTLLWLLYLFIAATSKMYGLSVAESMRAWAIAPFSPIVLALSKVYSVGRTIVRLPWGHALDLLLEMLLRPAVAIRKVSKAPFSKVRDAQTYLLAYALSSVPFWLLIFCLERSGLFITKLSLGIYGSPIKIGASFIFLTFLVSLVELVVHWWNHGTYPTQRKRPSEIHRWGALFRVLFVVNATVDISLRTTLLLLILVLSTILHGDQEIVGQLSPWFLLAGLLWKTGLGVVAVTTVHDMVPWSEILLWPAQVLRKLLSEFDLLGLGRIWQKVLWSPQYVVELVGRKEGLKASVLVFAGSIVTSILSGSVVVFSNAWYGDGILTVFQTTPVWLRDLLSRQGLLLAVLLSLAAGLSWYISGNATMGEQSEKKTLTARDRYRLSSLFPDYMPVLTGLLLIVGAINILVSLARILLSLLGLSSYNLVVLMLGVLWETVWIGRMLGKMTNRPPKELTSELAPAALLLLLLLSVLSIFAFDLFYWPVMLVGWSTGLAVWIVLAMSPERNIPSGPLSYILERDDLRIAKHQADAYSQAHQYSDAHTLYLEVLQASKVLRDPSSRLNSVLKQLRKVFGTPTLPEGFQLLPIRQDITSALAHLSKINVKDALEYIGASIITGRTSPSWERAEECRYAALEALANMVAEEHHLVFENVASWIDAGVTPGTLLELAQLFDDGILSEIYMMYQSLLAYEEMKRVEQQQKPDEGLVTLQTVRGVPGIIKQASSVFAKAKSIQHGAEVFLIYSLLSKSIEARFFPHIVAINMDYSQLVRIDNPLFSDVISVLRNLAHVTELLVRSEKTDVPHRLPYYARIVEVLDRMEELMRDKKLLSVEKDAITTFIVPRWKNLILDRLKALRGGTSLSVALARADTVGRQGDAILIIRNDGDGIAENVGIEVDANESTIGLLPLRQEVDSIMPHTEAKLAFRTEPTTARGRHRVVFNILYDDLERTGKGVTFADAIVLGYEEREFRCLDPIPYIAGPPLHTSEMFFGRSDVFEFILENLPTKSQDNIILLHGERRTGKTSLLYQLRQKLGQPYVPVLIDLQGVLDPGPAAFLHDIALRIHDVLEEKGIQLLEPELGAFAESPGAYFKDVFLKDVTYQLGERRLVLMVDEFEVLEYRVQSGDLEKDIFAYLRHLMQHHNIDFIFAGTYDIVEIAKSYWSVLFNTALSKEIELLSRAETYRLIKEPVAGYFKHDPYALDKAWQVTAGHPFFVQLLCRELVRYGNRHEIPYFTIQDVRNTVDSLIEMGDIHLGYIWDSLSDEKKILLVILSDLLQTRGVAILSEIQTVLERHNVFINLDESIRELLGRGIIQQHEGRYSFRIGLICEWIYRTRSLESLML